MAALSDNEKHAIVTLLGQFAKPADVVVHIRREFGTEIDRFQVRAYDPANPRYEGGAKWRPIFDAARAAHLSSIEAVPIAHKGFRMNTLQRILEVAMAQGKYALARSVLRQAAKEAGNVTRAWPGSPLARPSTRSPADSSAAIAEVCRKLMDADKARRSSKQAGGELD